MSSKFGKYYALVNKSVRAIDIWDEEYVKSMSKSDPDFKYMTIEKAVETYNGTDKYFVFNENCTKEMALYIKSHAPDMIPYDKNGKMIGFEFFEECDEDSSAFDFFAIIHEGDDMIDFEIMEGKVTKDSFTELAEEFADVNILTIEEAVGYFNQQPNTNYFSSDIYFPCAKNKEGLKELKKFLVKNLNKPARYWQGDNKGKQHKIFTLFYKLS